MAAVANLPFYSTSYGENFGYNERDGTNPTTFRNRYLNEGYRGTAELGPVRFNATRAQGEADLPHANVTRPFTTQQQSFARTQGAGQTQSFSPSQTQQQSRTATFRPLTATGFQQAPSAMQSRESWEAQANRSTSTANRFGQTQHQQPEERFTQSSVGPYANQPPRAVHMAPVQQQQQFYPQQAQQQQQQFQPSQSLSAQRLAQQAAFSASMSARFALPSPNAQPSVNSSPFYIPPYEAPPATGSFAPSATARGNRTYTFNPASGEGGYEFGSSFRGGESFSNKPPQDPGQSIPFGRLQADDAKQVRHNMAMSSWDTFHVQERSQSGNYNLSGLANKQKQAIDPENYGKASISRRLPEGEQLRAHLPGYCGFVKTQAHRHGATYGKTTRMCIAGSQVGL